MGESECWSASEEIETNYHLFCTFNLASNDDYYVIFDPFTFSSSLGTYHFYGNFLDTDRVRRERQWKAVGVAARVPFSNLHNYSCFTSAHIGVQCDSIYFGCTFDFKVQICRRGGMTCRIRELES